MLVDQVLLSERPRFRRRLAVIAMLRAMNALSAPLGANADPSAHGETCVQKEVSGKTGSDRTDLSRGYSLLYQQATGIPKLNWLLMFKNQSEPMAQMTTGLVSYYQELGDKLQALSKQYPAVRIDVPPMSDIQSEAQKNIGTDLAKEVAPLAGKKGRDFEREVLLMLYSALNQQRHLVAVMAERETEPQLRKFLQARLAELDLNYNQLEELLNRRYFRH